MPNPNTARLTLVAKFAAVALFMLLPKISWACTQYPEWMPYPTFERVIAYCSSQAEALQDCTDFAAAHSAPSYACVLGGPPFEYSAGWFTQQIPFALGDFYFPPALVPPKNLGCPCPSCCKGDPVNAGIGNKVETKTEYVGSGVFPLRFSWTYNSINTWHGMPPLSSSLGRNRTHSYSWQMSIFLTGATIPIISVQRPDGIPVRFTQPVVNGSWVVDSDQEGILTAISGSGAAVWEFQDRDGGREWFDSNGRLVNLFDASGYMQTVAYDTSGRIASVTDPNGRVMTFDYNSSNLVSVLHTPDAGQISFTYSTATDLTKVTYQDSTFIQYLYDESAYSASSTTGLLTGVIDEKSNRYSTTTYNSSGWGTSTVLGTNIDSHAFSYLAPGISGDYAQSNVTLPLGATENTEYVLIAGVVRPRVITTSCTGCQNQVTTYVYDSSGRPSSKTVENEETDYTYNDRGLVTSRVDAANATGAYASVKRTINTTWDSNFRFPDSRSVVNASGTTETTTNWVYNSRGQVLARCQVDPAISGATSYTCGSLTNAPTGVRQTSYTYCESGGSCPIIGLVLAINGPRTDVSDVTTFAYYSSTDTSGCVSGGSCHYLGDLYQVTNSLGQVTTYVSYDKNGRITRIKDGNGTLTDMTYHARGWLLSRTVRFNADGSPNGGDTTTSFAYDDVGNVAKITDPDGVYTSYTYDGAHRLTDITDNLGNTIHYTLDAAGNRKQEDTKDPSSTVERTLSRQYDQLNRLTKMLNASSSAVQTYQNPVDAPPTGITYTNGYDGNGNAIYSVDGRSVGTEQQYDPLNRLTKTLQDHTGLNTATQDTTTQYFYDARDNLLKVIDPDNLPTSYTYDGLNNLTVLSSTDTGVTSYGYDDAGNRTSQIDARGIHSTYAYDALNRLTGISYPTSSLNVAYGYDEPNTTTGCTGWYPIGHLTSMTDASGTTYYCYNRRGNLKVKKQFVGNASGMVALTTTYTYTQGDRPYSITYPSGAILTYTRDSAGRIVSVTHQASSTAPITTLISSATYYPFGPLQTLTYGNGHTLTKTYDQDYAIDKVQSSLSAALTIDATVDVLGNIVNASSTIAASPPAQVYAYDPLYRLQSIKDGSNNLIDSFTYNRTGDRLSETTPSGTTTYGYTSPLTSHRLMSIGGVARSYDANGNLLTNATGPLAYDDRNRMIGINTGTQPNGLTTMVATYNGKGERVRKQNGTTGSPLNEAWFSYDEGGQLIGRYGLTGSMLQEYFYMDGVEIGTYIGTLYYVETDYLGSPRVVVQPGATSATDSVVWKWDFFGSAFGTNAPSPAVIQMNQRFPGQFSDAQTGLNYNYFRDYEPGTGRYVESDATGLADGSQTYAYAHQTPLSMLDKRGLAAALINFPPDKEGDMKAAIEQAIEKLKECTNLPGCWREAEKEKVIQSLQSAKFVYDPENSNCGETKWFLGFKKILISDKAFSWNTCCDLSSTLAHEANHYHDFFAKQGSEDTSRELEKKCFNCPRGGK